MMKLPKDKEGHLYAGAYISIIIMAISLYAGCQLWFAAGIVSAGIAGLAKELLDLFINWLDARRNKVPRHSVELHDFVYTLAGGLILPAVAYYMLTDEG